MSHIIKEFKNGFRLIYQHHNSNVSHFGIIIDAGTRDESEDIMGMAHFIEHMLFKGTKKRRALQIINRLEEVGGEINAYTTKDKTCIYASFAVAYIERAIELLMDVTFNSTFPEKEMEKEKKVILEEIDMYADTPEECINDEFQELLFKNHPLGYNILGRPDTVTAFTQKASLDFLREFYRPEKIVFSYVGGVPVEKIEMLCKKHLPALRSKTLAKRKKFRSFKTFNIIKETDHAQSYCILGGPAYKCTAPQKNALLLLNNLLGGPGLNSRLNLAVREKHGYAYQVDSGYTAYEDCGYTSIYFGTDPKYLDKTLHLIEKELKRLTAHKLSDTVLDKYKKQMAGQMLLAEEGKVNLMLALGRSLLEYNRADTLDEVIQKIYAVTAREVLEVARDVFDISKMSRLVYKSTNKE